MLSKQNTHKCLGPGRWPRDFDPQSVLAEDLSLLPNTHVGQVTAMPYSSSRDSDILLSSEAYTQAQKHIHVIKINKKKYLLTNHRYLLHGYQRCNHIICLIAMQSQKQNTFQTSLQLEHTREESTSHKPLLDSLMAGNQSLTKSITRTLHIPKIRWLRNARDSCRLSVTDLGLGLGRLTGVTAETSCRSFLLTGLCCKFNYK